VEFLALLLFFAVARSVIGALGQAFRGASKSEPERAAKSASDSELQSAGELRKDPVCGTFVSTATPLKRVLNGQTYYFCSVDCRDRFAVSK